MPHAVGVLALQGSVQEHLAKLKRIENIAPRSVRTAEELKSVDALILPGGESTVIGKLLRTFGLMTILSNQISEGMPVWGTCAGTILLARKILGESPYLGAIDITVARNAYGTQSDSFRTTSRIAELSDHETELVFIRAPKIISCSEHVSVICSLGENPVAVRQNHILATTFHPELTNDLSFHSYFASMI